MQNNGFSICTSCIPESIFFAWNLSSSQAFKRQTGDGQSQYGNLIHQYGKEEEIEKVWRIWRGVSRSSSRNRKKGRREIEKNAFKWFSSCVFSRMTKKANSMRHPERSGPTKRCHIIRHKAFEDVGRFFSFFFFLFFMKKNEKENTNCWPYP